MEADQLMADDRLEGAWTPYVAWMKHAPAIPNNLMGSNLLHCTVEDLPGVRERLELDAFHEEGYPPLLEAIGERYGLPVDRIALATGASGAISSMSPVLEFSRKKVPSLEVP